MRPVLGRLGGDTARPGAAHREHPVGDRPLDFALQNVEALTYWQQRQENTLFAETQPAQSAVREHRFPEGQLQRPNPRKEGGILCPPPLPPRPQLPQPATTTTTSSARWMLNIKTLVFGKTLIVMV